VVRGSRSVEASRSVDVGSVRLTERHLAGDPPSEPEVLAARTDIEEALDEVEEVVPLAGAGTLVGLAGSVTTVMACALDLPRYDPAAIHRSRLPVTQVRDACDRLLGMSRAERAALPYMHPGRVDVIGAGALVWWAVIDRLVERSNLTHVTVSEHDILDGIAFSIA
jgi:exopolyphosphatase/guanosine-5'-triphosphate,3'-diphosphate pyrophosphatase